MTGGAVERRERVVAAGIKHIALIVIGLALVCAGFIFWPRASRTEAEEKTPRTAEEEKTETGGLADLVQRLNESRDEDPLK
jgi:hypothetical protein